MRHSESFAQLAVALVKAQGEMHAVAKDATNPHYKSKYASLDVIVETIRPILAENHLGVLQGASSDDGKVLTVETMLVHKSGEWIASDVVVPLAKIDPQGAGGALTYGRRYGLSALLNIVSDEDDDGNQASRPNASQRNAQPAATRSGENRPRPTPAPVVNAPMNGGAASPQTSSKATSPSIPSEKVLPPLKLGGIPMNLMSQEELTKLVSEKRGDPKYAKHVAEAERILAARTPEAKFAAEIADQEASLPF